MRDRQSQWKESESLTGELMLAKTVIEEKNEMLDQKDCLIRELSTRLQALERQTEELRTVLSRANRKEEVMRAEERAGTTNAIISDVVRIAASYEDLHGSSSTGLASRIYSLFEEKYHLRVIADPPQSVDPQLHHVVEVDHTGAPEGSIEILSNGYRLGETVIRPALVKVILGVRRSGSWAADDSNRLGTIEGE